MFQSAVASPTASAAIVVSAATIRPEIYEMLLSSSATPADNALLWRAQRFTAAGTTTAYVPTPNDPADPAALSTGGVVATGEPTYTAAKILFSIALNQRSSHRWISDPRGPLKMPATASNGIGLYPVHASFTGVVDGSVFFNE